MRPARLFACLVTAAAMLRLAPGLASGVQDQGDYCPSGDIRPQLDRPYQWKAGKQVKVWIDLDGEGARRSHPNPSPRFTLDDNEAKAIFAGINLWGDIPETGVTFTRLTTNADYDASYWVTVTWPEADILYLNSNGHLEIGICRVPQSLLNTAAYSCSFEDEVNEVSQSHTVIATLTMLNTHHTYVNPADGQSYLTWAYREEGWLSALAKVGAHENGHAMGLSDLPSLFPGNSPAPHIMKPFNGANDAAPHGGTPRLIPVTSCDRSAVLDHPAQQYERWICAGQGAVPPPPCPTGEVPICRNPESRYPAPVWTCSASGGSGR